MNGTTRSASQQGVDEDVERWQYDRGNNFPDLEKIERANTKQTRWKTTSPRAGGHQLQDVRFDDQSHTVEHDDFGRVTARKTSGDGGHLYRFDQRGRLAAVLDEDQNVLEEYFYDADGRLVSRKQPSAHSQNRDLVWDGDHIIRETSRYANLGHNFAWGALQDQLIEIQQLSSSISGPTNEYPERFVPLTDHRNSVVGLWSAETEKLETIVEYTPHGRLTVKNNREQTTWREPGTGNVCSTYDSPFMFGSMFRSGVTGLSYMRNRWYSPRLKQFLSPDPAGYVDSYNPYAYVAFDPINGWDPNGLKGSDFSPIAPVGEELDTPDDTGEGITEAIGGERHIDDEMKSSDSDKPENPGKEMLEGASKSAGNAPSEIVNLLIWAQSPCSYLPCDLGKVPKPFEIENPTEQVGANILLTIELSSGLLSTFKSGGKVASRSSAAGDDVAEKGAKKLKNPCSFTGETKIRLCDGSMVPIAEMEAGDQVLSRDAETGAVGCKTVEGPHHETKPIVELTIEQSENETERIDTTANHPFWVEGNGWTRVEEIEPGAELLSEADDSLVVTRIRFTTQKDTVYNFGVEEFRSYFVGESGAWVHNCWTGGEDVARKKFKKHKDEFPNISNWRQYVDEATDFLKNPPDRAKTVVRNRDGRKMVWDPKTDRFGILEPDGKTPSTFYKLEATKFTNPKTGKPYESNAHYWQVQSGGK